MDGSWERLPVLDLDSPEWWRQPAEFVQPLVDAGHRVAYVPGMDAPMLLRYRDIRDVLAMPEVGAMGLGMLAMVGWTEGPFVDAFGQWLVTLDPPDHDRLRRLASQPFTPRQVETVATLTRTTAQRLADEMADAGTVDLYEAFGERLALSVLCEVLGVPPVDHGSMAAWIAPMAECLGNPTPERRVAADEAMVEFAGYVMSLIEERRLQPGSDLLSRLIEAEERGERLTNQELVATTAQLLFAGLETTRDLIGAAVFSLLCHPDELARLREDRTLVANAVEEVLRYEPPVIFLNRPIVGAAITIGAVTVSHGEWLLMDLASANRDPEVMGNAALFDVGRSSPTHLSFSWGPHFCLGASIARMETRIALETVLDRFSGIEFAGDVPDWKPYTVVRSLDSLRITLHAA